MPTDLPINVSTYGADIDALITFIWWIVAAWFVAAEALLLYLLMRGRQKDGVRARWLPGDTLKASLWVLVPAAVVLVFDLVIEVRSHHTWQRVKGEVPIHEQLVRITGRQFVWSFTYSGPDGVLDTADDFDTINELHVPVGQVVRFELTSLDVLHSFFVPAMRLKQDAVPGRAIPGWFEVTAPGRFEIACAELCGAGHGAMRGELVARSEDEHAAWASAWAEQRRTVRGGVAHATTRRETSP